MCLKMQKIPNLIISLELSCADELWINRKYTHLVKVQLFLGFLEMHAVFPLVPCSGTQQAQLLCIYLLLNKFTQLHENREIVFTGLIN